MGAGGCKQPDRQEELITIDMNASHPERTLILQDFMDVEYIPLETNDEFITQGNVMEIGNQFILVKNRNNDGDIFIFDRNTGKGIRKINKRGQGAEEYGRINSITLDEDANEIFVNSTSNKKIYVYDLSGNFKRSLDYTKDTEYLEIFDYNQESLIGYDISGYYKGGEKRGDRSYHAVISKKDGHITNPIFIPFDIIKAPTIQEGDGFVVTFVRPIISYHGNWLLVETSSDTIYKYISKEHKLSPFLVKKPSKDPEVLLTMGALTDRYYFMQAIEKKFNFTTGSGFPTTDLFYDTEKKAVFRAVVLNNDYVKEKRVDMITRPVNGTIAAFQILNANQLVEAYENNELKGALKDIAAELNEESNPVVMLMKYKK
ncbi:6-bladed beta-propeller [Massilibacteroides sp.]|uniref:6-bladed beta-propeller n=1 Tax=Massilibacteroides sp. TaxID=2034766 RepID=UPI002635A2C2|nr:6-bladed beta-propeller [Massilibacteroides sp.]MDD4514764.1 6-bladed beta-propeller [Massilibacteroides sp.]